MLGKLRPKLLKWTLAVCGVLGLAAWWFQPSGTTRPAMVLIPAGDFLMGDQSMTKLGNLSELPVHTVRVSAFFIGNCEVTKAEWDLVREWGKLHGFNDLAVGGGKAPDHPVQEVSWHDVVKWCNARSLKEGLKPCYTVAGEIYQTDTQDCVDCDWSANGYRLPTEAEWEKAARGGLVGKEYPWGDSINHSRANHQRDDPPSKLTELWNLTLGKVFPGRSGSSRSSGYHPEYETGDEPYTSPVASFSANGYGLHDVAGNVEEWCWDPSGLYPSGPQTDPRGAEPGSIRVIRGGSWSSYAYYCRAALRYGLTPGYTHDSVGFRIARSSVPAAGSSGR